MEYDTTLGLCVPDTTNSPDSSFQTIGPALRAAFVTVLTILTAAKTYWYRTHLELFAASSLVSRLYPPFNVKYTFGHSSAFSFVTVSYIFS